MSYLNPERLIFSPQRKYRILRHSLFWMMVFVYQFLRISIMYSSKTFLPSLFSILEISLVYGTCSNIFFTYSVIYFLVPEYLGKGRYFLFGAGIFVLIVFILLVTFVNNYFLTNSLMLAIKSKPGDIISLLRPTVIRIFGNGPLYCGIFWSIRTFTHWHLEQLKSETLDKETKEAELQLLKAQVHPHFLFNTLNNIYSFTLTRSSQAVQMVSRLAGMLHYMVDECEGTMVPLEKEIKLLEDYIGLEKVRYGNQLNLQVRIKGEAKQQQIAPLLMIPFLENSFKHGTSKMLKAPWLRLVISIEQHFLLFELTNSIPALPGSTGKKGIGLMNVQKRLSILYPENHELLIQSSAETYHVRMKVPIFEANRLPSFRKDDKRETNPQTLSYD